MSIVKLSISLSSRIGMAPGCPKTQRESYGPDCCGVAYMGY